MGIHTTIETNGYFGDRLSDAELDTIDLVMLGLKTWDPARHEDAHGPGDRPHARRSRAGWRRCGKPVWIRFVLVPGLTDDPEDMAKSAAFAASLGNVERVEVLPFHQMGRYKWERLGLEYTLQGHGAADAGGRRAGVRRVARGRAPRRMTRGGARSAYRIPRTVIASRRPAGWPGCMGRSLGGVQGRRAGVRQAHRHGQSGLERAGRRAARTTGTRRTAPGGRSSTTRRSTSSSRWRGARTCRCRSPGCGSRSRARSWRSRSAAGGRRSRRCSRTSPRSGCSEIAANNSPTSIATSLDFQAGFDAAWELDFWGRYRNIERAEAARHVATVADYDTALVSLTAEVARTYAVIRTFEVLIAQARQNVELQEEGCRIADSRFSNGATSELDVCAVADAAREHAGDDPTARAQPAPGAERAEHAARAADRAPCRRCSPARRASPPRPRRSR